MIRGPLNEDGFKGQFSGHETFPLRHLWLRKAYDAVEAGASKTIFTEPDAIVRFGVGRNMVLAIRFWALACGIIEEVEEGGYRPTLLGRVLFRESDPWDPYMEQPATAWLLHWKVAGDPRMTTTWYWAFNHVASHTFDHDTLADSLWQYCRERGWSRVALKTITRDVECFVRSYVSRPEKSGGEDHLEPVLAELGLIRGSPGRLYEFRRGAKPALPDAVFAYALDAFWNRYSPAAATLAVEAITYEPGSPGQVFKLDEDSVIERLASITESSKGAMTWSDTAGVRQVSRRQAVKNPLELLSAAYKAVPRRKHA